MRCLIHQSCYLFLQHFCSTMETRQCGVYAGRNTTQVVFNKRSETTHPSYLYPLYLGPWRMECRFPGPCVSLLALHQQSWRQETGMTTMRPTPHSHLREHFQNSANRGQCATLSVSLHFMHTWTTPCPAHWSVFPNKPNSTNQLSNIFFWVEVVY